MAQEIRKSYGFPETTQIEVSPRKRKLSIVSFESASSLKTISQLCNKKEHLFINFRDIHRKLSGSGSKQHTQQQQKHQEEEEPIWDNTQNRFPSGMKPSNLFVFTTLCTVAETKKT